MVAYHSELTIQRCSSGRIARYFDRIILFWDHGIRYRTKINKTGDDRFRYRVIDRVFSIKKKSFDTKIAIINKKKVF